MTTGTSWRNRAAGLASVLVLLALWETAARILGDPVLWPGLAETFRGLLGILADPLGRSSMAWSLLRALAGFSISAAAGTASGMAAGRSQLVARFLDPILVVVRSTPVMAIILFALLWFRTGGVPVFTASLVVFPIVYGNVREGWAAAGKWDDLRRVYGIGAKDALTSLSLPALAPSLLSGFSTGLGIAWKAVVAAEILILPARALGTGMRRAQNRLDTAYLMAWTVLTILLSGLTEALVRLAFRRTGRDGR